MKISFKIPYLIIEIEGKKLNPIILVTLRNLFKITNVIFRFDLDKQIFIDNIPVRYNKFQIIEVVNNLIHNYNMLETL